MEPAKVVPKSTLYARAHREQYREYARRYSRTHRAVLRERFNKWKAKNPERWKWLIQQRRFRSYGLFQHEYEEMFMEQDGCCAICEEPFDRTPHIDHDHETDEVRGLLCTGCNTGLGKFMDSPSLLVAAVRYLLRHMNGK